MQTSHSSTLRPLCTPGNTNRDIASWPLPTLLAGMCPLHRATLNSTSQACAAPGDGRGSYLCHKWNCMFNGVEWGHWSLCAPVLCPLACPSAHSTPDGGTAGPRDARWNARGAQACLRAWSILLDLCASLHKAQIRLGACLVGANPPCAKPHQNVLTPPPQPCAPSSLASLTRDLPLCAFLARFACSRDMHIYMGKRR